ncbi:MULTISPECIES: neutral zinc metallopeptidase [unclassified Gordonia (in: high G+C Gram-positive bacteria)]
MKALVTGHVRLRVLVALAVTVVGLAACSGNDGPTASDATSSGTGGASSSRSSVPSSTVDGDVPGECTESACPELPVPGADLMSGSITRANAQEEVPGYLTSVLDDLDATWGPWFDKLGWGQPYPGRVLVESGRYTSDCEDEDGVIVVEPDTPNAFFCPLDTAEDGEGQRVEGSIILPVETFVGIWTGVFLVEGPLDSISGFQGEFTAATVVAHEYGHAVVDRILTAGDLDPDQEPRGENSELIADCLAGNWAATVLRRDQLSVADIVQAATLLQKIGDPAPGEGHGTATQRIAAISRGFFGPSLSQALGQGEQGQPIDCLGKYWPELFG